MSFSRTNPIRNISFYSFFLLTKMIPKFCCSVFIPRRRCIFIFVVISYICYITWVQQNIINITFLKSVFNLNCNNRDKVCKKCPEFYDKLYQLKTCFKKNLVNTKFEISETNKDDYLPTKALNIISNISDFCNEEFFLKISGDTKHLHRYKNNLLQLLTVNGPKIGEGYGTSLFLKSDAMTEFGCRVGFVGIDGDITIERQLKLAIPECKLLGLSQNLSNDTKLIVEILKGNISEGNLTKSESEEIENYENLANLIEVSFREKPLDGLFIRYWFTFPDFLEFLEEIEVSENSICQINARIKIPNNSFEAASKQFLNLFDSDFYPLHIDVRGNELQIFFINYKRVDCVQKIFPSYCNNIGWIL